MLFFFCGVFSSAFMKGNPFIWKFALIVIYIFGGTEYWYAFIIIRKVVLFQTVDPWFETNLLKHYIDVVLSQSNAIT